jgi:hypothetical protein
MLLSALLVAAAEAPPTCACSVPVFRYALEHWEPDPYTAYIFHRDELTAEQQSALAALRAEAVDGTTITNLTVRLVNLETDLTDEEGLQRVWEANQTESLPQLVLYSPPKWGPPQKVWAGEFSAQTANLLLESPVRAQIKDRLISGDSVVWVLLEGGDKQRDDLAFELLTAELALLQNKLKLSEIKEEDRESLSVDPGTLKVAFSAVRLSRNDPAELPFVEMLLGIEPDLRDEDFASQPMVFPVFGRGRALYALVGNGIAANQIEDAGRFLTGDCQCTVKRDNPGVDLMMSVDWNRFVEPSEALDAALPPLAGFSGFGKPSDSGEDIITADNVPGSTSTDESADQNRSHSNEIAQSPDPSRPADATPPRAAETGQTGMDRSEGSDSAGALSRNLKLVLMLIVGAVVIATLFLRPRAT